MTLTDEQKAIRRKGIGGSEIAAVAGINPWKKPIDVWRVKVGKVEEDVDNFNIERGNFLEGGLRDWLGYRMGYTIDDVPTTQHSAHELVIATPDGIAISWDDSEGRNVRIAAVELKSPNWRTAGDWEDPILVPDGIPDYYIPQTTWECAVLGTDRCDVGALIGGDLKVYTVPFNKKLFEVLVQKAEQFWEYVIKEEPPPVDGSDSTTEWLKKRFPQNNDKPLLTSSSEIEKNIHQLKIIREGLDELKAKKSLAENLIKDYIGDAPGVEGPWGKITWKNNKPKKYYDNNSLVEHLRQKHPDILKGFQREAPGPRVFRPYWAK